MRATIILQLAVASGAYLVPPQNVFSSLEHDADAPLSSKPCKDRVVDEVDRAVQSTSESTKNFFHALSSTTHSVLDAAWSSASEAREDLGHKASNTYQDVENWLDQAHESLDESTTFGLTEDEEHDRPPHRKPPHHRKPHLTVYEMINKSKYTTKLAKLINKFPDVVEALNGTKANYTIFAPTDRAFDKIPDHAKKPKPSDKVLKKALLYHLSGDFYPASRILTARTIPSLLDSDELGKKPLPQRLATEISFRGLTVNFYSRVVAPNIFGTNGVIHGVDSLIVPPPDALDIVDLLPSAFSTLELGLLKTGLAKELDDGGHGGTLFAPSNWAFAKLGPRINGFLFSKYGQKYLKALLKYHVVPKQTLYSDAFYKGSTTSELFDDSRDEGHHGPPRGFFHVDLPTVLEDRHLSIDVARYGRLIEIKINGFARVSVSDLVARDGVVHELASVLIPPKKLANGEIDHWDGESELSEEELMDRLDGWADEEL